MDDDKKKQVMIGVIVLCLVAAGGIFFLTSGGGGDGLGTIPEGEMYWVKCNNPACNAEYQIPARTFHKFQMDNINPLANSAPPMECKECGKKSVYRAEKCENCGKVFFRNSGGANDFADRCPSCKHSAEEARREARRSGQQ